MCEKVAPLLLKIPVYQGPLQERHTSLLSPEIVFQASPERPFPKMKLVNTRVFLTKMEKKYGHEVRLTELPEEEWDVLLNGDFEYVYLMGIYKPSKRAHEIALQYQSQYRSALTDMTEEDVVASPFAISEYEPSQRIALDWQDFDEHVRDRLNRRKVKVVLDWILYDMADDSPLVIQRPDLFIQASDERVLSLPDKSIQFEDIIDSQGAHHNVAHAGGPGEMPWIDKVQLDLSQKEALDYKLEQIIELSKHCDALRIDMAKLGFPWVIEEKWKWLYSREAIEEIKRNPPWNYILAGLLNQKPHYETIGELYDDNEIYAAFEAGFSASYDEKTLLLFRDVARRKKRAIDMIPHLRWLTEFTDHQLVEYSENHDTVRVKKSLGKEASIVLAAINCATPRTIHMIQEGQEEGCEVQLPMQLKRSPDEVPDKELQAIYQRLYRIRNSIVFQQGTHHIIEPIPCHPQNDSYKDIVVQQAEVQGQLGMMQCSNTGVWESSCKIPIPPEVKEIRIYDPIHDLWLSGNRKSEVDKNGFLYMQLNQYQIQVVYYAY